MNRALLVGINKYPTQPLNGCVNDVQDMADFLVARCGFAMDDIRLLVDNRATKKAIVERLHWLVSGLQKGDRVLFHYSGHGVQLPTRNPQGEVDGLDEAICPVEFDWSEAHTLRDDEFNKLFSVIPQGVEFIWISDSCHSGDLWRDLAPPQTTVKTIIPPADINWRLHTAIQKNIGIKGLYEAASELNLVLIAGCRSNQTSADACFNNKFNGALTYFLLQELKEVSGLAVPLSKVVSDVGASLKKARYSQTPQLEGDPAIKSQPFLTMNF
jgi:metacaspase-1